METFKFCLSGSRLRRNAPIEEDGGSIVAIDDGRGGTVRPPWKPCGAREEAIKLNSSRRFLGTQRCWHSLIFKGLLALFTTWLLIIDVQLHCTGAVGGDLCPITAGSTISLPSPACTRLLASYSQWEMLGSASASSSCSRVTSCWGATLQPLGAAGAARVSAGRCRERRRRHRSAIHGTSRGIASHRSRALRPSWLDDLPMFYWPSTLIVILLPVTASYQ